MTDLEKLREDNERKRQDERFARLRAAEPLLVRLRWWLIVHAIAARDVVRACLLLLLRRPLYVRCLNAFKLFAPCHRDATRSYLDYGVPIICAECDDADGGICTEVGRYHRAPPWVHGAAARAYLRPEGKPLGWKSSS